MTETQSAINYQERSQQRLNHTPLSKRLALIAISLGLSGVLLTACDEDTPPKAQDIAPEPSPPTLITPEQTVPTSIVEVKPTPPPTQTPETATKKLKLIDPLSLPVLPPTPLEGLTYMRADYYGTPLPFGHRLPLTAEHNGEPYEVRNNGLVGYQETQMIGAKKYVGTIISGRPTGYRIELDAKNVPTVYLSFSDPDGGPDEVEVKIPGDEFVVVVPKTEGGIDYLALLHSSVEAKLKVGINTSIENNTASVSIVYYKEINDPNDPVMTQALLVETPLITSPEDIANTISFDLPNKMTEKQQELRTAFEKMYEVALNPQNQGVKYDQLRIVLRYLSDSRLQQDDEGRPKLFLDPSAIPHIPGIDVPDLQTTFGNKLQAELMNIDPARLTWENVFEGMSHFKVDFYDDSIVARKAYAAYERKLLEQIIGEYYPPEKWDVRW